MSTYTITWSRLGRGTPPQPMTIEAKNEDQLVERLYVAVRPFLRSRDFDLLLDTETGEVTVGAGFHVVGEGQVTEGGIEGDAA